MTQSRPVDPATSECSITLHDGTTLSAATMPALARSWAAHVMGADWWNNATGIEHAGASAAMFNELTRAFDVQEAAAEPLTGGE